MRTVVDLDRNHEYSQEPLEFLAHGGGLDEGEMLDSDGDGGGLEMRRRTPTCKIWPHPM